MFIETSFEIFYALMHGKLRKTSCLSLISFIANKVDTGRENVGTKTADCELKRY